MGRTNDAFEIVIAGAGPAGLLLACELALVGVRTVVLDRNAERPDYCRGFNLNARTLELLDRRGIADRFLAEGYRVPFTGFGGLDAPLPLDHLDSDHRYTLGIPQIRVEQLLEQHAIELGVPIRWDHEVVRLEQDEAGVTVGVRGERGEATFRASYLAGCDGGRSRVRGLAGIGFPGTPPHRYYLLGDVEIADPASLPVGSHRTPLGGVAVIPRPGYVRVITADPVPPAERADRDAPVTLEELAAAVRSTLGRDVEMRNPRWLTRFGDGARQAERYVAGRVVLAGDAAHVQPPAGARGLSVGLQDAFNLGWKLAAHVQGWAPPELLESYHAERHPAGAAEILNSRAQVALAEPGERFDPLRALFADLAKLPEVRRYLTGIVTGVDTHYNPGNDTDQRVGRLAPNLELTTPDGPTRVSNLLHRGRGVLLDLADRPDLRSMAAGWSDRVDVKVGRASGGSDVAALLIRPDGYAAWSLSSGEDVSSDELRAALGRWFGRPAAGPG